MTWALGAQSKKKNKPRPREAALAAKMPTSNSIPVEFPRKDLPPDRVVYGELLDSPGRASA